MIRLMAKRHYFTEQPTENPTMSDFERLNHDEIILHV